MTRTRLSVLLAVLVAMGAALLPAVCQAQADEPVVHVVMFYGPTCPHCHEIIKNVLPPLQERYGDQLDIMLVNTQSAEGDQFFHNSAFALGYPEKKHGTPLFVIGDTPLRGEEHAVDDLPVLIASALEAGGNDWPDLPGIEPFIEYHLAGADVGPLTVTDMPIAERLALDPSGSVIAIIVLVLMLVSLPVAVIGWWREGPVDALGDLQRSRVVVLLALVGLVVASYLAYVEMTDTEAVCGPVGHCNLVQQSPYATLFGILPVGLLGVIGYLVILALVVWRRLAPAVAPDLVARFYGLIRFEKAFKQWSFPLVAMFGVLFSVYLTTLEPFVIGAVCMWCVSSAITMMLMLWLTTPIPRTLQRLAGVDRGEVEPAPEAARVASQPRKKRRSLRQRVTWVLGYVFAQAVGILLAWFIVHYSRTELFPPPAMTTVAEANLRAAIDNSVLIGGMIVGPLFWHVLRYRG